MSNAEANTMTRQLNKIYRDSKSEVVVFDFFEEGALLCIGEN